MEKLLIGIDVGTSACKAAAFRPDGTAVAQATVPWPVYHPVPGWAEQDADEWWQGVCQALRQVLAAPGVAGAAIAGVGVDGQSWSAIPVDGQGRALARTPIWMDTRAADIAGEMTERVGAERIFATSGNALEPTYTTAKILWFARHRPDVHRQARWYLQSNAFVVLRLTGRATHDLSQGYGVHAFDMAKGTWDDALCDDLGLPREKLAELVPCHEVVGTVTAYAAELTGLPVGTPVVAGGLDACCGTLGAGVCRPGQTQEQGGMAGGMSICQDRPRGHRRLILGQHVVPGQWLLQGGTVGGGGALRWFRQEFGAAEEQLAAAGGSGVFARMGEEAAGVPPGAGGLLFLPYLAGERSPLWDRHAKGMFFGLGYEKSRAHAIRAVMEGVAFALEHNLQTAYETGVTVDALNAMGGSANSEVWTQIKSDVTGKVIHVPASDTATTLGAALLAGVGVGVYGGFEEAVARTVRIARTHTPDGGRHALYGRYWELYRELYERTHDLMARLDAVTGEEEPT